MPPSFFSDIIAGETDHLLLAGTFAVSMAALPAKEGLLHTVGTVNPFRMRRRWYL
jgi:hypothetical protein